MKIFQIKRVIFSSIILSLIGFLYQITFNQNITLLKQVLFSLPFAIIGFIYFPLTRVLLKLMKREPLAETNASLITEVIIVGMMLCVINNMAMNSNLPLLEQFFHVLPIALIGGISLSLNRIALKNLGKAHKS